MGLDRRCLVLTAALLLAAGCRSGSSAPQDSSIAPPVDSGITPVVTTPTFGSQSWTTTTDDCPYVNPDIGTQTTDLGGVAWVPGCPIVAADGWHFFEGGAPNWEMVICQSAWSWEEAEAAGVFAALQLPADIGPSTNYLSECEDLTTGEAIWKGFSQYWIESGPASSPSYTEGYVTWFTDQDARIRSAYLEYARGALSCQDRDTSSRVVFGEPLFTPEPHLYSCKPPR